MPFLLLVLAGAGCARQQPALVPPVVQEKPQQVAVQPWEITAKAPGYKQVRAPGFTFDFPDTWVTTNGMFLRLDPPSDEPNSTDDITVTFFQSSFEEMRKEIGEDEMRKSSIKDVQIAGHEAFYYADNGIKATYLTYVIKVNDDRVLSFSTGSSESLMKQVIDTLKFD